MLKDPDVPVFLQGHGVNYRLGLLRLSDRTHFPHTVDVLVRKNLDLHLTGNVVEGALAGKPGTYGLIELTVGGDEKQIDDLRQAFRDSKCRETGTMFDRGAGNVGQVSYNITEQDHGSQIRYHLVPTIPLMQRRALDFGKPSAIVLNLISRNGHAAE